jgi:hypothetical protein
MRGWKSRPRVPSRQRQVDPRALRIIGKSFSWRAYGPEVCSALPAAGPNAPLPRPQGAGFQPRVAAACRPEDLPIVRGDSGNCSAKTRHVAMVSSRIAKAL